MKIYPLLFLSIITCILPFGSCNSNKKNTCNENLNVFEVIKRCDLNSLKKVVENDLTLVDLPDTSNYLYTPLFHCVQIGDVDKFNYLLSKGADIYALSSERVFPQTDILYVTLEFDSDIILKRILELKAFDLNKKYIDCENAVYTAVRNNSYKCLRILLQNKIDVNVTNECSNENGISPLGWAALENAVDAAKLLIEYGVDVNKTTDENESSVLALNCTSTSISLKMVKLLVESGADVDKGNSGKVTPLMFAINKGEVDVVKYLISKGANVNARTSFGNYTPLHYACSNNDLNIASILISENANPNVKDMDGKRPIDKLKSEIDKQKFKALIKKKASIPRSR